MPPSRRTAAVQGVSPRERRRHGTEGGRSGEAAGPELLAGGQVAAHLLWMQSKGLVFPWSTEAWWFLQPWHPVEFRKL